MPVHRKTTNNNKMAIHKQSHPPPSAFLGFNQSYKRSTNGFIRSTQQPKEYQPRRSQRLAKQRKARTSRMQTMESDSNSTASSSSKKPTTSPFTWKQTKATIRPQKSQIPQPKLKPKSEPPDPTQPSFLERLTESEISRAISYYYDFPQNLPYRECGAHVKARGPVPDVLVKFDENIFARRICLRPISRDDLESVDPFTLETGVQR